MGLKHLPSRYSIQTELFCHFSAHVSQLTPFSSLRFNSGQKSDFRRLDAALRIREAAVDPPPTILTRAATTVSKRMQFQLKKKVIGWLLKNRRGFCPKCPQTLASNSNELMKSSINKRSNIYKTNATRLLRRTR